jgi:hypothetical protein
MTTENNTSTHDPDRKNKMKDNGMVGGIYGMAFIGAAVYFLQHAATFWEGVLGIVKAIFWPAILIYKLLEFLKM